MELLNKPMDLTGESIKFWNFRCNGVCPNPDQSGAGCTG